MMLQPLVENSIKHGCRTRWAKGAITIRSLREADHAIIDIIDNGIGIPAADAGA
jgi:sensor histidine kinase YesM